MIGEKDIQNVILIREYLDIVYRPYELSKDEEKELREKFKTNKVQSKKKSILDRIFYLLKRNKNSFDKYSYNSSNTLSRWIKHRYEFIEKKKQEKIDKLGIQILTDDETQTITLIKDDETFVYSRKKFIELDNFIRETELNIQFLY